MTCEAPALGANAVSAYDFGAASVLEKGAVRQRCVGHGRGRCQNHARARVGVTDQMHWRRSAQGGRRDRGGVGA